MRSAETTNRKLDEALKVLAELTAWAEEDAEHARAHEAPSIERDDKRRAAALRKAASIVKGCKR